MTTHVSKSVYGYPAYTKRIKEYAERIGAELVLDHIRLPKADEKKVKIVVDAPCVLERLGIPIIGYVCVNGVYHKTELPNPALLVKNKVAIVQLKWRRLPKKLFKAFMATNRPDKVLAEIDPKSKEAVIARAMFSRFHPASFEMPWEPPKKKEEGGKVNKEKKAKSKKEEESHETE